MARLQPAARFGAVIEGETETVVMDVTPDDTYSDDGQVTSHEIDDGSEIHDHVILHATTVSLRGILSDTPHTGPAEDGRALNAYRALLAMRDNRERVAIITEARVLEPVVLSSVRRDNVGPVAAIGVSLEGTVVRVVSSQRVFLPPARVRESSRDRSSDTANQGQQGTEPVTGDEAAAAAAAVVDNRTGLARTVDQVGDVAVVLSQILPGGGGVP